MKLYREMNHYSNAKPDQQVRFIIVHLRPLQPTHPVWMGVVATTEKHCGSVVVVGLRVAALT